MQNLKFQNTEYLKSLLFYLAAFLLLLVRYVPYSMESLRLFFPLIEVAFLYYFYIYRDEKPLYIFIFFMALLFDGLNNYLIGSTATIYFLILFIFKIQEKLFVFDNFNEIWIGFVTFTIQITLLKLAIIYFVNGITPDYKILALTSISTVILYPILHNFFHYLAHLLNRAK